MNKQERELYNDLKQYDTEQLKDMLGQYEIRVQMINDILYDRWMNS